MKHVFAAIFVGLWACGAPRVIDDISTVNTYIARGDDASACGGVRSANPQARGYTAGLLAKHAQSAEAAACICEAFGPGTAAPDDVLASAVAGSGNDAIATCLLSALDAAAVGDKPAWIAALGGLGSARADEALSALVADVHTPEAVAAAALSALGKREASLETLREVAVHAQAPAALRGAAVQALALRPDAPTTQTLVQVIAHDAEPWVRAAAVEALGAQPTGGRATAVCDALRSDADAMVRKAAAARLHGTTSPTLARCLADRLREGEPDPDARAAVLDALKRSKTSVAKDALCAGVGPLLRAYAGEAPIEGDVSLDIMEAQNTSDFEKSYTCVEQAIKQGGYKSCQARLYLAQWMNKLGGSAREPTCPGAK